MNRTTAVRGMLACGLALAGWTAAPALAQTNVTLYGRVAAGIDYQNNVAPTATSSGGSLWRGADNQWGTSMFGLMGKEDLGGGLKAVFRLESGFHSTDGTTNGNALFNRRSYVGLSSPTWGTLTAGKNLFISNDVWFLDPTGQQFIGSATLVRGRNWPGANNIVEYQIGLQTGLGEQPGSFKNSRRDGVSAVYTAGPVEVRAIYDVIRDANGKFSDLFNFSKEATIGGTYTLGKAKLFAVYENLSAPDAPVGAPTKANHYWLGVNYELTPALTLIGAAYRINVNNGGGNANLFMLGANYNLSKRTMLYASVGTVQNSATANFSVEATNNNPAPGKNQLGAYTGVVHSF